MTQIERLILNNHFTPAVLSSSVHALCFPFQICTLRSASSSQHIATSSYGGCSFIRQIRGTELPER